MYVCTFCVYALVGLVTLAFHLLTLKLVCQSHLRWRTFLPKLGTIGHWVLELFAVFATDVGRTDRRTDGRTKATLIAPFPSIRGRRHNNFRGRMATAIQQVQSS